MTPRRHVRAPRRPPPRFALLAAVGLMATGLLASSAAAETPAERAIDAWATTIRASGATIDWRTAAAEGDRIDLTEVTIAFPSASGEPARLRAPSLTLVAPSERGGDGFAFTRLAAPRIEVSGVRDGEPTVIEFADVEIGDAVVPKPKFPPFDPTRPFSSSWAATAALDVITLGRATIGRATLRAAHPDGGERTDFSVEDFVLAGLGGGRLERLGFGRSVVDVRASDGRARLAVADAEILGLDTTPWRRFFAERVGSTAGGGTWEPTLRSARFGRVSLTAGDVSLSIAALRFAERSVRTDGPAIGAIADRLIERGEAISDVDKIRLGLEMFLATRNAGWSLEGLSFAGPGDDRVEVARIAVGAFSGEGFAEMTIKGIAFAVRKASLRLDRLALADLRLPDGDDLRRAVQAAAHGAEVDPSSVIPTFGHFSIRGLEIAEPGVPAIRLGALSLDLGRHIRAVPTEVAARIEHFVVPAGLSDAEGRKVLADLGYERIDVSAAAKLAWDEAKREIAVEKTELEIADVGKLEVVGRLVGVPASLFHRPETAAEVIGGIALAEARATYTDASFVGRLLRMITRGEKTMPEKMKRRIAREVEALHVGIADPARRRRMVEETRRFLTAPKSITATARPHRPVPLAELAADGDDPAKLIERLDVTLRAER
ncbi:MAG: hypothetical protein OEL76_09385 [Siculibacillus sp.]|nr:hypothetical protein [Siculibacillus sp.]